MPRRARITIAGIPWQVIQRGNNREPCFFAEADYQFYLECIRDAAERYRCEVHAYVLMTNHVHLLVNPAQHNSVPRFMQHIGRRYVQYINYTYRRSGTLWEGRYKASLVDVERYLFTCYRYIELNPVFIQHDISLSGISVSVCFTSKRGITVMQISLMPLI